MLYVIETDKSELVKQFVAKTKQRMQDPSKTFAIGEQDIILEERKNGVNWLWVFISPKITNIVVYLGIITLLPMLLFLGVTWWLMFPIGILSLKFFESSYFGIFGAYLGLRYAGYKGRFKVVSTSELLGVAMNDAKRRIK